MATIRRTSRKPAGTERTPATCHAREMLVRIADKWSMYAIHVLAQESPLRFNEMKRRIDGVSQRMLTVTLRGLERDGLVRRTMYPEVPPRVEYQLTPLGETLRGIVCQVVTWTETHLHEVDTARAEFDKGDRSWALGTGVRAALPLNRSAGSGPGRPAPRAGPGSARR
jgi:DNA-binding HxlR family transcriptional regulator